MVPASVAPALARYLELTVDRVPTLVVIGSVALGDFQPGASDIDLVAVVDSVDRDDWCGSVHARVRAEYPDTDLETLYVTAGDLARPPARLGERAHHLEGRLRRDSQMVTPVIWHSVWEHGRVLRGSAGCEVWLDDATLREWCRGNLRSYWAGWAARGASPASRAGMALLTDWGVEWCVLGVLRLRYTIETGAITSKTGAGRWALAAGGLGDAPLVEEALALRSAGVGEQLAPADRAAAAARRERVVAFMRRVIADA